MANWSRRRKHANASADEALCRNNNNNAIFAGGRHSIISRSASTTRRRAAQQQPQQLSPLPSPEKGRAEAEGGLPATTRLRRTEGEGRQRRDYVERNRCCGGGKERIAAATNTRFRPLHYLRQFVIAECNGSNSGNKRVGSSVGNNSNNNNNNDDAGTTKKCIIWQCDVCGVAWFDVGGNNGCCISMQRVAPGGACRVVARKVSE